MNKKISEKYLNKMKIAEKNNYDVEAAHVEADRILCDLLKELGYIEIIKSYENVERWHS